MEVRFGLTGGTGGCNHARLTITRTSDERSRTLHLTRADLFADRDVDEIEQDALAVARHLVKTAGATTPAQVRAVLEGKVVKL